MTQDSLSLDQEQLQLLWQDTCQELEQTLSPLQVDAWGKTSHLQEIGDFGGERWLCTFVCPSSFNALQFEKTLAQQVRRALAARLGRPIELKFVFNLPAEKKEVAAVAAPPAPAPQLNTNSPTPTNSPELSHLTSPPISPSFLDAPANSPSTPPPPPIAAPPKTTPQFSRGLFTAATIKNTLVSRANTIAKVLGLRQDFTFDTFAVSSSNEMAHAVALSVAKNPGVSYNPLFIYGGVGVGKTHLLQSIGNHIIRHSPEAKLIYCTSEDFTNSFVKTIQTKQQVSFHEKYRQCHILLIDDIQFIAGKNAVQEEFFHTFNALVRDNRQIVLTSDRPPHEITLLEDRIRSRFEAGLKVDIQQPSFELRSAILLAKASAQNLSLPVELAQTIAARIDSARKLEGIIKQLKSAVEVGGQEITSDLVTTLLAKHQEQQYSHRRLHPREVLSAVANHYSIKQMVIVGTKRQKEIVRARHVAMFLLKDLLTLSYSEIGQLFSNRDHTSVIHAVNKINEDCRVDQVLAQEVSAIRMSILGGAT